MFLNGVSRCNDAAEGVREEEPWKSEEEPRHSEEEPRQSETVGGACEEEARKSEAEPRKSAQEDGESEEKPRKSEILRGACEAEPRKSGALGGACGEEPRKREAEEGGPEEEEGACAEDVRSLLEDPRLRASVSSAEAARCRLCAMHGYACREDFETACERELTLAGAEIVRRSPGFLLVALAPGPRPDPAFAHHSLPDAQVVEGDSVARLAKGAFDLLAPRLDASSAWTDALLASEALRSRGELVLEQILAIMKEKRRRSFRRRGPQGDLVQLGLLERNALLVSFATPGPLASGFLDPTLPPTIPEDKKAPSSAFKKAEEAYALLGEAPGAGETVADLGAAPGGWSYTALRRGAHVTAVDKAELLPPVAGAVTHLRKDAFSWTPEAPFEWLLCDAIAAPDRSIDLLDAWLKNGWCRRFVLNVKFKGRDDYGKVEKARSVLAQNGVARARIKQLPADKNEVTVLGSRAPRA
jgi:23S rRNA (cytidine2498-2'-O)-methyltransferase